MYVDMILAASNKLGVRRFPSIPRFTFSLPTSLPPFLPSSLRRLKYYYSITLLIYYSKISL